MECVAETEKLNQMRPIQCCQTSADVQDDLV